MKRDEQIERIAHYEALMNGAEKAIADLQAALTAFEAAQDSVRALSGYYGSEQWKRDFADDEAGLLPGEMPRGVLSEDGIYNLLTENQQLLKKLKQAT